MKFIVEHTELLQPQPSVTKGSVLLWWFVFLYSYEPLEKSKGFLFLGIE